MEYYIAIKRDKLTETTNIADVSHRNNVEGKELTQQRACCMISDIIADIRFQRWAKLSDLNIL